MSNVRVVMNKRGAREVLSSPEVGNFLLEKGENIASRAKASYSSIPGGSHLASETGAKLLQTGDRKRVTVGCPLPSAMRVEADHGVLVRALGA